MAHLLLKLMDERLLVLAIDSVRIIESGARLHSDVERSLENCEVAVILSQNKGR